MRKHFHRELVMIKKDNESFNNSIKYSTKYSCDDGYGDDDDNVRDHCNFTEKCRSSSSRDFNIKVKLNHKIPVAFHNLKKYDSHLIMQELDKINFKSSVAPNGLRK